MESGSYMCQANWEPLREPGNRSGSLGSVQGWWQTPGEKDGSVASFPSVRITDPLRGLQKTLGELDYVADTVEGAENRDDHKRG